MSQQGEVRLCSDKPGCIAPKAKASALSKCQRNKLPTKPKGSTSTSKAGKLTRNKNSRKQRRGPIRHIDLIPGVIEDRPQLRAIIPNIHSRDDQPVFNASTDDSRVRARLGMMVFWVLALQRHPQERSPVLTYGVCDRTRSALSLQ